MDLITVIAMITFGSLSASSFYVPLKYIKAGQWEVYWLALSIVTCILLPWTFILMSAPANHLRVVLNVIPYSNVLSTIFWGAIWGVGGLFLGLSIKRLGIGLGQSLVVGIWGIWGLFFSPLLGEININPHVDPFFALLIILISMAAIGSIGYLNYQSRIPKIGKAFLLAVGAGLMSVGMNIGYVAGIPIDHKMVEYGVNPLFQSTLTLAFILLGGFIPNAIYCLIVSLKNQAGQSPASINYPSFLERLLMTLIAGGLWYLPFYFLGLGKNILPLSSQPYAWSLWIGLQVIFAIIWGILLLEPKVKRGNFRFKQLHRA
ncbi:L-rhamnose/proton symporter RhaT [Persicobacter diffluens]|uniref:Sugar:proton symporter n=1 Tax=Persicobacter diffluens TaxID=981 RepID=A0AAN5ALU7_9BACT|nr:sugar:proton symporter [Persicobacter diffluens]